MEEHIQIILEAVDRAKNEIAKVNDTLDSIHGSQVRSEKDNARAVSSNRKLEQSYSKTGASIKKMATALVALVSARVLGAVVKSSLDAADAMSKLSREIRVTTEDLSVLRFAAERSNIDFQKLQTGLRGFVKRVGEASKGAGEAVNTFRELGISTANADGSARDILPVFLETADVLDSMQNSTQRSTAAAKLFGDENARMLNLFEGGSASIKAYAAELTAMGGVLSTDVAQKAEMFNDQLTNLKTIVDGVAVRVGAALAPSLKIVVGEIIKFVDGGKGEGFTDFLEKVELTAKLSAAALFILKAALNIITIVVGVAVDNMRDFVGAMFDMASSGSDFGGIFKSAFKIAGDALLVFKEAFAEIGTKLMPEAAARTEEAFIRINGELEEAGRQVDSLFDKTGDAKPIDAGTIDAEVALTEFDKYKQGMREGLEELQDDWSKLGEHMADVTIGVMGAAVDTVADQVANLVDGTASWAEAWTSVGKAAVAAIIKIVLQWILANTIIAALQKVFSATSGKAAQTEAITTATAWAPAALAASIATLGGASVTGLASFAIAMALGTALGAGLSAAGGAFAGGFDDGGIVPGSPSSRDNRIATVATGEGIIPSDVISAMGPRFFEYIRSGDFLSGGLPSAGFNASSAGSSFISGGIVGSRAASGAGQPNIGFINSRKDKRRFQETEGALMTIDMLQKRGNRINL